jgi:hypothetical protein
MRGDGQNQLKISLPHHITEAYQLMPLLDSLISLDSPFKEDGNDIPIGGHHYLNF